jgi:hypothetical protein
MGNGRRGSNRLCDKVSNGSRLLPVGVDMRSPAGRRFRYLVESYSAEIGGDGNLTEAEKAMVRQIAALQVFTERQQARVVSGEDVDADQLIRLNSEHRRLLGALHKKEATKRESSDAVAELQDYLAQSGGNAP